MSGGEDTFNAYTLEIQLHFLADPKGTAALSEQAAAIRDDITVGLSAIVERHGGIYVGCGHGVLAHRTP